MKILALIPARGGSKRLPGKNIRILGNKPMIVWSIIVAKDIEEICDTLVSTDDDVIRDISLRAGALVPWLRPAELATDEASSVDVALHALHWYEVQKGKVDGLLLLQPTSPFRTAETIRKGIELFKTNRQAAILGVSPTHAHPMWTFKIEGDCLIPFITTNSRAARSQDLPPAYVVNGSFYLISPAELRTHKSFFGLQTIPLIMPASNETLDIDTDSDWAMAQTALIELGSNLAEKIRERAVLVEDEE